mmetsp:Transcript_26424/g.36499  ORF Transcript_26424/g.36499 Transcript_26424/m.36499 type:complete len:655 (+) Transcript_26424:278-2242(+)|eukprot:CAMPEP_0196576270 /NCGR_PEP_ID=MMETSP1081-20130531/5577_1 /TAXON_ID=36882 /ORGANISM="Pyramimonas amylifera, Strain CCMP720" /LENGTH=654 /DNA_ID=CAMNT_0041894837 /DNA_START=278 /DNA_END=2242 /DNA_ORIENTATION=+
MRKPSVARRLSLQGKVSLNDTNNYLYKNKTISKPKRSSFTDTTFSLWAPKNNGPGDICNLKQSAKNINVTFGNFPRNLSSKSVFNLDELSSRHFMAGDAFRLISSKIIKASNTSVSRNRSGLMCQCLQLRTVNLVDDWMLGYPPASKFLKRYHFDPDSKPLGVGNYGVVHRVTDRTNGKHYAVKSVKKMVSRSGKTLLKIRSEAKILTQLGPSLDVGFCYGVWEDAHKVYMLLELCEGGDLLSRKLSEERVMAIVKSILRVVGQCHAHNIAHRDIKPQNFMFLNDSDDSPIRAIDFGLATYVAPGSTVHDRCGTIHYCAPEVINMTYGLESDLWSLGVLAYQLLTGCLPFADPDQPSSSNQQIFNRICKSELTFDGPEWDAVSLDGKHFVKLLLQRDVKQRPSAVQALHHRWLEDVKGGTTFLPLEGSVIQRLQRFGSYGRFKQLVMQGMARELVQTSEDTQVQGLRALFEDIDRSHKYTDMCSPPRDLGSDGLIHIVDLKVALAAAGYNVTKEEFFQLAISMQRLHSTEAQKNETVGEDHLVSMHQFVAALIDWRQVEQEGRWLKLAICAFNTLDRSGSGFVNPKYLSEFLCELNGDRIGCCTQIANLLRDADRDGDEFVSLEDFLFMVQPRQEEDNLELYESRFHAIQTIES